MKEKIIETVGKTWRALGAQGESNISDLCKAVNEKEDIVNQSIGWLAREDKINYSLKRNKLFVSLVDSELQAFRNLYQQQVSPQRKSKRTSIRQRLKLI